MKYQGVLFDLYGTLVDPFRSSEGASNVREMAAALDLPPEDVRRLWEETFQERETGGFPTIEENIRWICRTLGAQRDEAQIAAAVEVRSALYRRTLVPRKDSRETLAALRSAGVRLALVSNAGPQTPELWRETTLASLVEVTVISAEARVAKPDPRIYRLAFEALGLAPETCLFVGDGGNYELDGARRVGLNPVLIRTPGDDLDDPHRPEAKTWQGPTVSAVSEVLGLVGV